LQRGRALIAVNQLRHRFADRIAFIEANDRFLARDRSARLAQLLDVALAAFLH